LSTGFFSVHPAANGYQYLSFFRAEEGEGGEEKEWRPTTVTPLLVQVASLTATSSTTTNSYGTTFTLPFKGFAEIGLSVYPDASSGDILLASTSPIEKINIWASFVIVMIGNQRGCCKRQSHWSKLE